MRIDNDGNLEGSEYERKLTDEEKIEHNHQELMRVIKPWLRSDPMEYEMYLRAYENHDIIRATYRLYALTREEHSQDETEILDEIMYLQNYIGAWGIEQLDWDKPREQKSDDEGDINYDEDEIFDE